MNASYWQRKASPWVSAAVLAGGLATALICVMLFRINARIDVMESATDSLEGNLSNSSRAYLQE